MSQTTLIDILDTIKGHLRTILPGQRIKYIPPLQLLWDSDSKDYNWETVEEIQMLVRGLLQIDTFVTLRFNDKYYEEDSSHDLLVDIYRLP